MPRGTRPLVLLGALLWIVLATAGPASAHADLVGSDPKDGAVLAQAPARLVLTFSEPVSAVAGTWRLRGPGDGSDDGAAVTVRVRPVGDDGRRLAAVVPDPGGAGDGTRVLSWRVVSDDGHPEAGVLTFHVGAPSPGAPLTSAPGAEVAALGDGSAAVAALQGVVRGIGALALLLAGGLTLFLVRTVQGLRLPPALVARLRRVLGVAAAVAIACALVAVPVAGAYRLGGGLDEVLSPDALAPVLIGGEVLVAGLQALGLAAAVWLVRRPVRVPWAEAAAALAVFSPALVGHTRAYEPSALLVLTDAAHLAAGAAWLGGLLGLALTLPAVAGRPRDAAQLLARFSSVAAGLLVVLSLAGLLLAWRILGAWEPLVGEPYGRLVLLKVALAGAAALLAAHNRWRLLPRVAGGGGHDEQRRAARLVGRTVAAEATLVATAALVTGFLTQAAP